MGETYFDATPDPIWGIDLASHRFVDANKAALTFSGYTREEHLEKCLSDVFLPNAVQAILSRCVPSAHPEFLSSPYRAGNACFMKRDGTSEVLEIYCYAIQFGSQTQYLYLLGKLPRPA